MKKLTLTKIRMFQKSYGFTAIQNHINTGTAWHLEGSFGRQAMDLLESGACMLPLESRSDAYGNSVPSRDMLKNGTKGTLGNSQVFWQSVLDGDTVIDEWEEIEE